MKQGQIAIAQFQQYLLDDGKSPKTIESYITDTIGLVEYLKTIKVQFNGQLKRNYITGYRNYLLKNEFQPSTINKKINSLNMFNVFLIKAGWMREIVVDIRRVFYTLI